MKKFIVQTVSESADQYTYFIKHPKKPNQKELNKFLKEHATDIDENGKLWEYVNEIKEIVDEDFLTIPQ